MATKNVMVLSIPEDKLERGRREAQANGIGGGDSTVVRYGYVQWVNSLSGSTDGNGQGAKP